MKSIILTITAGICSLVLGYLSYSVFFGDAILAIVLRLNTNNQKSLAENVSVSTESAKSLFEAQTAPIYTPPMRLLFPKYNMDIPLLALGVDSVGQLEAPKLPNEGGWYYKSAKAGEEGNVLINAHYDDNQGRPAAFYNLKSVKVNDTVILVDSYDRQFPYRVTEIYYIGIYDEDRIEKLLESEGASLTLVTCGGFWLPGEGTYNQRLIVKATLEK
jgi:LPXTG-site transpeptidase (sortase) family protein